MLRIALILVGVAACMTGVAFLIAGGTHWLAIQYGVVAACVIVGGTLVLLGVLVVGSVMAGMRAHSNHSASTKSKPADTLAAGLAALPEHLLHGLGADDLQGLALICKRRPLLASGVALALGLGVGLNHRRH